MTVEGCRLFDFFVGRLVDLWEVLFAKYLHTIKEDVRIIAHVSTNLGFRAVPNDREIGLDVLSSLLEPARKNCFFGRET